VPRARIELGPGEQARVFGPARIRVVQGTVSILGAELAPGEAFELRRYRSYPVTALSSKAVIEVEVSEGGKVEAPAEGESHYLQWLEVADKIIEESRGPTTVMVVGPVEAGKTSFAALQANRALAHSIISAIVDADIGQADIGPPGFVSLAIPSSWVEWLRSLEPVRMKFVGSIEPAPVAGRLITATRELVDYAKSRGSGIVVVDTDGWVEGWQALELKADMAWAMQADYIVVLGSEGLASYLRRTTGARVYSLPSPNVKAERDRSDRRMLRAENYRRFLEGVEVEVDLTRVRVRGSCSLGGEPLKDDSVAREVVHNLGVEALLIAKYPGGMCIVVDSQSPPDPQALRNLQRRLGQHEILVVHTGGFQGVLSALTDRNGNDYPAILKTLDLKARRAVFSTCCKVEPIAVSFSRLRLGEDFTEIARGRVWV
jgi:polynucleotide 5'-hydroxyl-kinase GRC3/NOL9